MKISIPESSLKALAIVPAPPRDTYYRDSRTPGLAVKHAKRTGRLSYIVEGKVRGQGSCRVSLGPVTAWKLRDVRDRTLEIYGSLQRGIHVAKAEREQKAKEGLARMTLGEVFEGMLAKRSYEPNTIKSHKSVFLYARESASFVIPVEWIRHAPPNIRQELDFGCHQRQVMS